MILNGNWRNEYDRSNGTKTRNEEKEIGTVTGIFSD